MTQRSSLPAQGHILADTNIGALLFRLSVPAFIGMATQALYNIVDAIYVGRGVGKLALAAISVTMPIQMFILAIGILVGIGSASIISRALGARNIERAERALGSAMFIVLAFGVLFAVFGRIYLKPLLVLFGASPDIMKLSSDYIGVILMGNTWFSFAVAFNNIIRSEGRAKIAMVTMLISAGLNIILDPIFIFALHMGVKGAAIATVLSQAAMAVWVLIYFIQGRGDARLRLRYLLPDLSILGEIFAIGSSAFAQQIGGIFLTIILNRTLQSLGGSTSLAAFGVVNRIIMFTFMPIFGLSQGLQPVAGFNYGAQRYHLTKKALDLAIIYASVFTTLSFIVLQLLAPMFIGVFTTDADLIAQSAFALRIMTLALPVIGFQIVGSTIFQAIGKPIPSLILTLSRQIIILLPLIAILPRFFHLGGVWMSYPIADVLSAVVTALILGRQVRQFNRLIEERKELELHPESVGQV